MGGNKEKERSKGKMRERGKKEEQGGREGGRQIISRADTPPTVSIIPPANPQPTYMLLVLSFC